MALSKLFLTASLLLMFSFCSSVFSQQQVDLSSASASYSGGFFQINAGISPGNITYESVGYEVPALNFEFEVGKRVNRAFAPYFAMGFQMLPKETNSFDSFLQMGMKLGSKFYLKNPNFYLAPEIGLDVLGFEKEGREDYPSDNMGMVLALKSGRDWHVAGKFFAGFQLFLSYVSTNNSDTDYGKATGFFYGVNLSLKFGKQE